MKKDYDLDKINQLLMLGVGLLCCILSVFCWGFHVELLWGRHSALVWSYVAIGNIAVSYLEYIYHFRSRLRAEVELIKKDLRKDVHECVQEMRKLLAFKDKETD